jgi:hypothetical protein
MERRLPRICPQPTNDLEAAASYYQIAAAFCLSCKSVNY